MLLPSRLGLHHRNSGGTPQLGAGQDRDRRPTRGADTVSDTLGRTSFLSTAADGSASWERPFTVAYVVACGNVAVAVDCPPVDPGAWLFPHPVAGIAVAAASAANVELREPPTGATDDDTA